MDSDALSDGGRGFDLRSSTDYSKCKGRIAPLRIIPSGSISVDFVHVHAVQAICDILVELKIEPEKILKLAGLDIQTFGTIEAISFASLGRLTALAADQTQCAHFGLFVGQGRVPGGGVARRERESPPARPLQR
ncbi:hypothetical protein [Methylobacterium sp. WSM2598]|uniref:hypothetical protein n=1 Tax=Methylobacterium sp. WSM2598 TaxID=398261 RepID=UPI0018DF8314|nr:hypothetical protein [Methylobacterium sp. WSM2598]